MRYSHTFMIRTARIMARILLCLCLLGVAKAWAVMIIANPHVSATTLSQNALRAMFAVKLLQWPDSQPVRVFVLPDDNPLHRAFCKEALDVYPYQLRQTWDRLVYSGTGQAPTEVGSEQEMLKRVATTPGALGYARKVKPGDRVRILSGDNPGRINSAE
ncbi:hypothetical protein TPL01_18520 [Sulfuriferula plumbiphila]|uniref:PBP domain-containing protein n=1 Tax=Sulfuriferula plumbiphila TaxID=171865 RepID=A0A512L8A3_9PROT|nr:hypothetical protein [Sulfuriferula plumbiphila]BBP05074.1 hypothetical protein SFPGR_24960 [Sulfuriferula plumbiphila]GEP30714.1 hypothetical protein TPL01_18520 [Sulfuriferula plumbiphila]